MTRYGETLNGFEGMYKISNNGKIKSIERKRNGINRIEKEHLINQYDNGKRIFTILIV